MSKEVRISVIIPVYNGAAYIDHISGQLMNTLTENDEIIFIDNNSTDESANIIRQLIKTSAISCILLQETIQGAGAARNKGLKNAKGKYIAFVDVDDDITPNRFSIQCDFLEQNKEYEIVFGKTLRVNKNYTLPQYLNNSGEVNSFEIAERMLQNFGTTPHLCSFMFKRAFLSKRNIQFPIEIRLGEDLFFEARALFQAGKVYFQNEVVYNYIKRKTSTTNESKQSNTSHSNFYNVSKYMKANLALFNIKDAVPFSRILGSVNKSIVINYRDNLYAQKEGVPKKVGMFREFFRNEFKLGLNSMQTLICYAYFIDKNRVSKNLFYNLIIKEVMTRHSGMGQ